MFYDTLTGKVTSQDITDAGEDIRLWYQIYGDESFGDTSWREYSYVSLDGRPHKRRRADIRAAKIVCSDLAGLIWSERPEFSSGTGVAKVFKDTRFWESIPGFTERAIIAGGGGAFKLYGSTGKLFIDFVSPDNFFPVTWDASGRITEADFVEKRTIDNKKYVRIEKHRKATREVNGVVVSGYEITNVIFEESNSAYAERNGADLYEKFKVSQSPVFFGTGDVPLFAYARNPEANNLHVTSPLGISIFANAVDTLHTLDIIYDALRSEIILGRKRIIVPAQCIRTIFEVDPVTGTSNPVRYFDPSDEIFQAFNTEEGDKLKISDNSVELRIEELTLALRTTLNVLAVQVGLSSGSLSWDGQSVKTATEVVSENSKTFKTVQGFQRSIGEAILQIAEAIKLIGPAIIKGFSDGGDLAITWQDSILEDRASITKYWTERYAAGTCSLAMYLEKVDGLAPDKAATQAAAIRKERQTVDLGLGPIE